MFGHDIRFSLRALVRNPAFAIASIIALTLAIGANTSVFAVVNALLNFSLPIEEPERVAFIFPTNDEQGVTQGGLSALELDAYRQSLDQLESLHALQPTQVNLVGNDFAQRVAANSVTPGFFEMTGRAPQLGRAFLESEGLEGGPRVVILSDGLWRQNFAARNDILEQRLRINGEDHQIVGVAPPDLNFGAPADAWLPLVVNETRFPNSQRTLLVVGRLRDGATVDAADRTAKTVAARLAQDDPEVFEGWSVRVPTTSQVFRQGSNMVSVLLYSAITFVLLIACANIANLLLARSLARQQEMALRTSLGAGRGRLLRQLAVESVVLALVGGGAGLLLGVFGVRFLRNSFAPDPNMGFIAEQIRMDFSVALHAVGISVLAGLIFGVVPAILITRGNLALSMREGSKSSGSRGKARIRSALVMAEVALAMALLITAGTLIRAFDAIYAEDPGFEPRQLLTLQMALTEAEYPESDSVAQFVERAVDELGRLPGVTAAAATTSLPLTQFPGPGTTNVEVDGAETLNDQRAANALDVVVTPGYFETLEIPVVGGRAFDLADRSESEPVAIVTEDFAARFFDGESPLDRRLRVQPPGTEEPGAWRRIVGVVGAHESHAHSLRNPAKVPQVFLPAAQMPRRGFQLVMRTNPDPETLAASARAALARVDRTQPVSQVKTLERVVEEIDTQNTVFLQILISLALVAMVLAAVGIYGVIAYGVAQRRREIGIRTALGARPVNTVGLVARSAASLTAVGVVIGSGLGLMLVRFMGSQLAAIGDTGSSGPTTFAILAGAFLAVATLASVVPTRRALRTEPSLVLRD